MTQRIRKYRTRKYRTKKYRTRKYRGGVVFNTHPINFPDRSTVKSTIEDKNIPPVILHAAVPHMVILTAEDITTIKTIDDMPIYTKINIAIGMGIEKVSDPPEFKIHSVGGSTFYISKSEQPNTYATLLDIYESGRPYEQVPVIQVKPLEIYNPYAQRVSYGNRDLHD